MSWYVLSYLWDGACKRTLAANKKSSPYNCSSGFPLLLYEWSFNMSVAIKLNVGRFRLDVLAVMFRPESRSKYDVLAFFFFFF